MLITNHEQTVNIHNSLFSDHIRLQMAVNYLSIDYGCLQTILNMYGWSR